MADTTQQIARGKKCSTCVELRSTLDKLRVMLENQAEQIRELKLKVGVAKELPGDPIWMVHRGWKFTEPFYCGRCGVPVSARQFAFSRSCGPCDVSDSRTARFHAVDKRWFGSGVLVDPECTALIHPIFVDPATRHQYPPVYRPKKPPKRSWLPIPRRPMPPMRG